eukprot:jgi/Chlat1/5740/Chrsp38S05571
MTSGGDDGDVRPGLAGGGLPGNRPIVLGLTGSIGMGKSTVAAMFQAQGVPVCDADQIVHKLYDTDGAAVGPVGDAFPGTVIDNKVSRAELSKRVVGDESAMKRLEAIVHPLVSEERERFIDEHARDGARLVVLDIPLLYETGAEKQVDFVAVVSAPLPLQRSRVLSRPNMTEQKFLAIDARQTPDEVKRERADFVIDTGGDVDSTRAVVEEVVGKLHRMYAVE